MHVKKSGFSLMGVLFFVSVLLVLTTGWYVLSQNGSRSLWGGIYSEKARQLAYAGLTQASQVLSTDRDWSDNTGSLFDEAYEGGHYAATLTNNTKDSITIVATGTYRGRKQTLTKNLNRALNAAYDVTVTTSNAVLQQGSTLKNLTISNTSTINAVSITAIRVNWGPDSSENLSEVFLGGVSVSSSNAQSQDLQILSTPFVLLPASSNVSTEFRFNASMAGKSINLYFTFSDASVLGTHVEF